MKPYISAIYEHDGKTHALPVKARYHELLEAVHALGIKDMEDEEDLRIIGYESLYDPKPDADERWSVAYDTNEKLSRLTQSQAAAVYGVCAAFGLKFRAIQRVIDYLNSDWNYG